MAFEHTLVQIRERSFLEVLDLALVVLRGRPLVLGLAALAGIAPIALLNAWLLAEPEFPLPVFALLVYLEVPWATAPLTLVLGSLMFGQRVEPWRMVRELLRALPALFLFQFLLRLVVIASFVLIPLIPARFGFLNEVILLERLRGRAALGRCRQLCARRSGDLFGQWLATLVFGGLFTVAFWFGMGTALSALTTSELTWEEPGWGDFYGTRFQVALWLAITFFAVARFLSYIDHRIRKEGWEIELRLKDVGRALEEARAW